MIKNANEPSNQRRTVNGMLRSAERLAAELNGNEIGVMIYNWRLSFTDVARILLPETAETNIKLAQMAISHAFRFHFPNLYEAVKNWNQRSGASTGGLSTLPNKKRAPSTIQEGHKLNTSWSSKEIDDLMMLVQDPEFHHEHGMHKGKPCFTAIAHQLNELHHKGNIVRTGNSCKRKYTRLQTQS